MRAPGVVSRRARRHRVGPLIAVLALVAGAFVALGTGRAVADETCRPFADVTSSNIHCQNIAWLKNQRITKPADGRFHPSKAVTRGSMTAFLFRLTNSGVAQPDCASDPYPDVPSDSPFCGYIDWAADHGIAYGYTDGTFRPDAPVTRGAAAAFLSRLARQGSSVDTCTAEPFDDVAVNGLFCPVITWMADHGLTSGVGDGTDFLPAQPVTRQAMASFLHRTAVFLRPPGVYGPGESFQWIPAGDHRVSSTLNVPDRAGKLPVVLMLHGDASVRDEVGAMYAREAAALARDGIASLRIDFAGSGASEEPETALSYPNMVHDAAAALTYLKRDDRFDPHRIAILGFSRGAPVAATLAGTKPGVAALATWSGAVENGTHEDPTNEAKARANGHVVVDLGFRTFDYSLKWFTSIAASHALDDVLPYTGPILAVVGSADTDVPPKVSKTFLDKVASTDTTLYTVPGANHIFNVLGDDQSMADDAIAMTAEWFNREMGRA